MSNLLLGVVIVLVIIIIFFNHKYLLAVAVVLGALYFASHGIKFYGTCEPDSQNNWRELIDGASNLLRDKKFVVSTHITGGNGDLIACIKIVNALRIAGVPKENIDCIVYLKRDKEAWIVEYSATFDKVNSRSQVVTINQDQREGIIYTVIDNTSGRRLKYSETVIDGTNFPINPTKQGFIDRDLAPNVNSVKLYFNRDIANTYQKRFKNSFRIAFKSQEDYLEGDIHIGETQLNKPSARLYNPFTRIYDDFITTNKEFNLGFIDNNPGSLGMSLKIRGELKPKAEFLTSKGLGEFIDMPVHYCYMESNEKQAIFIKRITSLYRSSNIKNVLVILNKIGNTLKYVTPENGIHIRESGYLPHNELLNMISISDRIVGCTGDQFTSEVIALGKFPFHETPDLPLPESIIYWCHKFGVIPEVVLFSGGEMQEYDNLENYKKYSKMKGGELEMALSNINYEELTKSLDVNYQNVVSMLKSDYEFENNLLGAIVYCMRKDSKWGV